MYSLPDNDVLPRHILGLAHDDLALNLGRVERRWNPEDDSVRIEFGVEVGLEVDGVLDFGLADLIDDGVKTEGEVDVGG